MFRKTDHSGVAARSWAGQRRPLRHLPFDVDLQRRPRPAQRLAMPRAFCLPQRSSTVQTCRRLESPTLESKVRARLTCFREIRRAAMRGSQAPDESSRKRGSAPRSRCLIAPTRLGRHLVRRASAAHRRGLIDIKVGEPQGAWRRAPTTPATLGRPRSRAAAGLAKVSRYSGIEAQLGTTGAGGGSNAGACRPGRGACCHSALIQSWIAFAVK